MLATFFSSIEEKLESLRQKRSMVLEDSWTIFGRNMIQMKVALLRQMKQNKC